MKKSLVTLLLSVFFLPLLAQKGLVKKGDEHFKAMAYPSAIPYYLKALKKDSTLQDAIFRLADCYRLTNNRILAETWYAKAVQQPRVMSIQKFYYGQSLMNNGKYAQARRWMEDFLIDNKEDGRGQSFIKAIEAYQNFFADSSNYAITKLDINSTNADFGAVLHDDGIVFASSRKRPEIIERTHAWTNEPFLALYYSRGKENQFREPEMFAEKLQTRLNDGPVCFNKKGDEIYITRNNIENGRVHKSNDKIVKLKLFMAKSKGGNDWGALEPFPYNNDNYNCAHAAISPDGQRLYFASDMPGTKGGMDLWMCNRQGTGWSKPINMGDTINTRGNELFPTVTEDGTIYFASDGRAGIGGLDIFYTHDLGNGYVQPVNMGYPINSPDDDFNLVYDAKNKIGYFSSNRANRGIDDDLYTFKKKSMKIRGIVVNKEDGTPIKQASIVLSNENGTQNFTTFDNGRFEFSGELDANYTLKGSAAGLGDTTMQFATSSLSPSDPFVRVELGKAAPFQISIMVIDGETKKPLPGAMIKDEATNKDLGSTDLDGQYKQPLVPEKDEQLIVALPGYRPKVIMLKGQAGETPRSLNYTVELTPASDIYPYENWYKIVYFDLDKFNIRDDAKDVMADVVRFLSEHKDVKISIMAHTDSRATAEYNEKLSERRAKTIKQYLADHGIPTKQIGKISWSGESMMVNNCGDGEPCTEEMHQLNRRAEITVNSLIK